MGIFLSSGFKRSNVATVISYAGIPLTIVITFVIWAIVQSSGPPEGFNERVFVYGLWIFASTNPFLAALISQLMWTEMNSLYIVYVPPITTGAGYFFFSPWIIYLILYVIMSFTLITVSARLVAKPEK
jgi:hypothetical protein